MKRNSYLKIDTICFLLPLISMRLEVNMNFLSMFFALGRKELLLFQ